MHLTHSAYKLLNSCAANSSFNLWDIPTTLKAATFRHPIFPEAKMEIGPQAQFDYDKNIIVIPAKRDFTCEEYYRYTLFHEIGHFLHHKTDRGDLIRSPHGFREGVANIFSLALLIKFNYVNPQVAGVITYKYFQDGSWYIDQEEILSLTSRLLSQFDAQL